MADPVGASHGAGGATNPRGIPVAPFVDKVEDYVASRQEVEKTLKNFQEMISKYQFMETNTQRRLAGLNEKVPGLQKTLDMLRFLGKRKLGSDDVETMFELNDTLYAKAAVPPTEEVYLWLGYQSRLFSAYVPKANVMLSYPIPEATHMLRSKLEDAKQKTAACEEDLDFLRDQITTMEVATARVYNWDIGQRRKEKSEKGTEDQLEHDES
ncbi:MAG: peptide chain release factor 1 [Chrysothrix sp. TS-e1954]|nr:MAG: peptide chain release factor 1 [Chrysothrix sp. TS-e1954]